MVMSRKVTAFHSRMGCHHHRKILGILFCYSIQQLLEETFRDVSFIGIWNSNNPPFSRHFDDMLIQVFLFQLTDGIHFQRFPGSLEYLVLCTAIVVASSHHYRHLRVCLMNSYESVRQHGLYCSRWLWRMINISTQ